MAYTYEIHRLSRTPNGGGVARIQRGPDIVRDFATQGAGTKTASVGQVVDRLIDLVGRIADDRNINLLSLIAQSELTNRYVVIAPKDPAMENAH